MFPIKKHKAIVSDLPILTDNYYELLGDENPILYTGTNRYGNTIIASIIEDDYENETIYYYHIIIDSKTYYDFTKKNISLYEILKKEKIVHIVSKDYQENTIDYNIIAVEDIPEEYLPYKDSYCPELAIPFALNFGLSLKGKKSDLHRVELNDINETQRNFYDILQNALYSLDDLRLNTSCDLAPSQVGSYRVNYQINFDRQEDNLFKSDNKKIAEYLTKYMDYILSKLPREEETLFSDEDKITESFGEIEDILTEIYKESHLKIDLPNIRKDLTDNINETAIKFDKLNNQVNNSKSFNCIEVYNYETLGINNGIGIIDDTFYNSIKNKLRFEEKEVITDIIEKDKTEQTYRILVYQLNIETGKGSAQIYHGVTEEFDKAILHIKGNESSISNSIYSNSLNEEKVVEVKGIAEKKNEKFKKLEVQL